MKSTKVVHKMITQTSTFLKEFNLKYPLIQSPMAGASTVEMAASIANLGGLGSIPLVSFSNSTDEIKSQWEKFQSLTCDDISGHTVNLNFFAHDEPMRDQKKEKSWIERVRKLYNHDNLNVDSLEPSYPTFKSIADINHPTMRLLADIKPSIVSFHFGLPASQIVKHLQNSGIKIFVSVTNLKEFEEVLSGSVDGVILQGYEAGGHRGNFIQNDLNDDKLSTRELTKQVVDYVEQRGLSAIPFIIAAGGFYDSKQIGDFIEEFGIAGVQVGTVFLPSNQATISERHLEYFVDPQNIKTIMTPAISGRSLRTISTPFLEQLSKSEISEIPDYPLPYGLFKNLSVSYQKVKSEEEDRFKYSAFLAGGNYAKSYRGSRDVKNIFEDLVKDLK